MIYIIKLFFIIKILILSVISQSNRIHDNHKKVNKLNVLLPQIFQDLEQRAPQYNLEAINGCYKWKSSNPKALVVYGINDQENPNCQSKAVVKLNTVEPFDNIIWIEVTDKNTEDVIKVESKIAKVHKIEILTKLRTVNVQDLSVLEIIGYDIEGNSFSSLEGLHFEWNIIQDEKIFEFITFKESKIQTTQLRKNIEESHFQSDLIVIKAIQTGQAQINVKLKEKEYILMSQNISLQAIDKFDIFPSNNLYLLPYTHLQYQLIYSKKSKVDNIIDLSQEKYEWKIDDLQVGKVSQKGELYTLTKLYQATKITVKPKKEVNYQVTSTVTVVEPFLLEILIKEFTDNDVWERNDKEFVPEKFRNKINLVKDREYYMKIVIYDNNRNPIKLTKNVEIDTKLDQLKFKILEKRNFNEFKIKPVQLVPLTEISSNLIKVTNPLDKSNAYYPKAGREIKNQIDVQIVMPVKLLKPSETIYLPNLKKQVFKLHVIGGSGEYKWDSTDNNVFESSQNRIHVKKAGFGQLFVSDKYNENNKDVVNVQIVDIWKVQPLEQMMEVIQDGEINTFGSAFFNSINNNNFPNLELSYELMLDEIQSLKNSNDYIRKILQQYEIKGFQGLDEYIKLGLITQNEINQIHKTYNNYGICSQFKIKAEQTGEHTGKLQIWEGEYQQMEEQNVSVKVFKPFESVIEQNYYSFFKKDEVVISMNSKYNWTFNYGPSQWENQRKINIRTQIENIQGNSDCDQLKHNIPSFTTQGNVTRFYTLQCGFCRKSQENMFISRIFVQNQADEKLPRPLEMENNLRIWCNVPHSLYIYPLQDLIEGKFNEWENAKTSKFQNYYLRQNMKHFFHINVFDSRNLPFYVFSSLKIEWSLSTMACGDITELSLSENKEKCENFSQEITKSDESRRLDLRECTGRINSIQMKAINTQLEGSLDQHAPFNVNDEIILNIAKNVECIPQQLNLYNNIYNKYNVNLVHGSGVFSVSNNSTEVVVFEQKQRNLQIQPLRNGASSFVVKDQQQIGSEEIECNIQVREPQQVILRLLQDIIPIGGSTEAFVEVLNDQGKKYSENQIQIMDIYLESDTSDEEQTLQIRKGKTENGEVQIFSIMGKKKGNYRLVASLKHNNPNNFMYPQENKLFSLKSNSVDLEVFPSLEAYPPKLVLHQLCQTSLQLIGGPSDSTRVKFFTRFLNENQKVISLQQIDSKLYDVQALAGAKGKVDLEFSIQIQNEQMLLSSTIVPVQVEDIDDAKIYGMNDRSLHLGTTVRLIAQIFIKGQQMSIGLCALNIQWQSKVDGVLKISQPSQNTVIGNSPSFYAVNATAIDVGVSEIELIINFTQGNNHKNYVKTVAKVDVISPALVPLPTYVLLADRKPSFLLIPPKSGYFLPLQNIQRYTFESSSNEQIKVDGNGYILTGDKKGISGHVKVQNKQIQQDVMSIHVHVVSIYSLIVENSHLVSQMQIEGESQHTIRMQDFLGRSFPTQLENIKLNVKVSNSKVLSAVIQENSLLQIRAVSRGVSICTVFLENNPHIYDTFLVSVDSIITPASPVNVHIGGWVQFAVSQNNKGSNQVAGKWSCINENVAQIDPFSGIAKAIQQGETIIEYNDGIFYKSKVYVRQIGEIVCNSKNLVLTNWKNDPNYKEEYRVIFQAYFKDRNGNKEALNNYKDLNGINNNLIFTCNIEKKTDKKWFLVSTVVHDDHIECLVKLHEYTSLYPNQYMPSQLNLIVKVQSRSENSNFQFFQEFKFVNLYWGVIIPEKKIQLNRNYFDKNIIIQTNILPDVSLQGYSSKNIIRSQQFKQNENLYEINVVIDDKNDKFNKTIVIKHPKIQQIAKIDIFYDPMGEYSSTSDNSYEDQKESFWDLYSLPWYDAFIALVIIGLTTIIFTTVYL
ncbi:nucleoporin 210, putative, partial [Ichthyophthirius multifiliis]